MVPSAWMNLSHALIADYVHYTFTFRLWNSNSCVLTEYGPLIGEIQARLHPSQITSILMQDLARYNWRDRVTQSSFLLRLAHHTFQHSNLCCTTTEAIIHELCSHHLLSSLSPGGKLVFSSSTPAAWDGRTTHLRVHPISSKWANSVVYQDIDRETSTYTEGMNWSCSGGWFS